MNDYSEYLLDEPEAPRKTTPPWRAILLMVVASLVLFVVVYKRAEIRDFYFPPRPVASERQPVPGSPASTALAPPSLFVDDINNEGEIIRELEEKYLWLWVMEVHRMDDGTVSVLSGIHPDQQAAVTAIPPEVWRAVSIQATADIINAFSPASRNGAVYMRYVDTRDFTLVGVLLCDVMGSDDTEDWRCQGASVEPPVAIQPDWVEYSGRLVP